MASPRGALRVDRPKVEEGGSWVACRHFRESTRRLPEQPSSPVETRGADSLPSAELFDSATLAIVLRDQRTPVLPATPEPFAPGLCCHRHCSSGFESGSHCGHRPRGYKDAVELAVTGHDGREACISRRCAAGHLERGGPGDSTTGWFGHDGSQTAVTRPRRARCAQEKPPGADSRICGRPVDAGSIGWQATASPPPRSFRPKTRVHVASRASAESDTGRLPRWQPSHRSPVAG